MKLSDKGLLEIAEHEGIVPAPYKDSVGVWTYGIGHTAAAGGLDPAGMPMGMPANMDAAIGEALEVFRQDVGKYEKRVNDAIDVPLQQHEFDALVSFDFNTGGIFRAKLRHEINAGNANAADRFMGWTRPPEIRKRRMAEMSLFKSGNYDANGTTIPVWRVDGKGNLRGIHSTVSGAEILYRMNRGPAGKGDFMVVVLDFIKAIFGGKK